MHVEVKEVRLEEGDSLEFSVMRCAVKDVSGGGPKYNKSGLKAVRVHQLARDTVKFEHTSEELYTGYVEREPTSETSTSQEKSFGCIRYEYGTTGDVARILFSYAKSQCDDEAASNGGNGKPVFYAGDKVQFNVLTCIRTNAQFAVNVKLIEPRKEIGYITMLKDNYGFIELDVLFDPSVAPNSAAVSSPTATGTSNKMPKDIFFHYRYLIFKQSLIYGYLYLMSKNIDMLSVIFLSIFCYELTILDFWIKYLFFCY